MIDWYLFVREGRGHYLAHLIRKPPSIRSLTRSEGGGRERESLRDRLESVVEPVKSVVHLRAGAPVEPHVTIRVILQTIQTPFAPILLKGPLLVEWEIAEPAHGIGDVDRLAVLALRVPIRNHVGEKIKKHLLPFFPVGLLLLLHSVPFGLLSLCPLALFLRALFLEHLGDRLPKGPFGCFFDERLQKLVRIDPVCDSLACQMPKSIARKFLDIRLRLQGALHMLSGSSSSSIRRRSLGHSLAK